MHVLASLTRSSVPNSQTAMQALAFLTHKYIQPRHTQQERVRQMTEELDSYCRSESFRIEFRRPDGNGWLTPAEAEAKGLCS